MATRKRPAARNAPNEPPIIREPIAEAHAQLRDRIEKGNAILSLPISDRGVLDQTRAQYYTWDEYNAALLKRLFTTPENAQEYSYWGVAVFGMGPSSLTEDIEEFHK